MSGQHFKETLEIVCKTTKSTKKHMGDLMGVTDMTICHWQRNGVPKRMSPYVMSVLRTELIGR
ncbi:hypothetical protein AABM38_20565 [Heyndrickxia sp. MSNUG]|uniref:hypothetical protein n=1 Tax=Heyndrickxia sp. MSNUG TaxID=3136677 RepID=UPI003C2D7102